MRSNGTILLSRQALRPCGKTPWVEKTLEAVNWLKEKNLTLCCSTGVQTWEMITALGSLNDLKLDMFLPAGSEDQFRAWSSHTLEQFQLDPSKVHFLPVLPERPDTDKKALWRLRDHHTVTRAHHILPVSIRVGGHMEALAETSGTLSKNVDRRFAIDYRPRGNPLAYAIRHDDLNPELKTLGKNYLIHWTRTTNTAWPGERLIDFYRDIITSSEYPRSAFHSLINILKTRRIRGTSEHMPKNTAAVSFSNRAPSDMTELIAWRSRYRLMSFEPYGIGIEKATAQNMNIKPVIYYEPSGGGRKRDISESENWLTQSRGTKTDWTREDEFRHLGDVDISAVSTDKMILICRTNNEAAEATGISGIKAVPFTVE